MAHHARAFDALRHKLVVIFVDLVRRHIDRDVVHRAMRGGARQRTFLGRCNTRHRVRRVGEPEEGDAIAIADVKEEVLSHFARQLDRFDQRHAENAGIELHRPLHILADEREMIDPGEFEFLVLRPRHGNTPDCLPEV